MSADDGVYVLETPTTDGKGFEYRVTHAMAIENIHWDEVEGEQDEIVPTQAQNYWGESEVYTDKGQALVAAHDLANKSKPWYPEYGVNLIHWNQPFSTEKE